MLNIRKYSAMAIIGAGLAFAAASPASACGAFGMVGMPVFGAAFGGCGPFGFAAPAPVAFGWGGGCAPVAFGCGGYGAYGFAPAFGFARPVFGWARPVGWARPMYGWARGYGAYGAAYGYGCHHAFRRGASYGYAMARRGVSYGYAMAAYRRPSYGYGVAYHRPLRSYSYASYRSYRPSRYAAYGTHYRHRNVYASYGVRRHYAMAHTGYRFLRG